VAEVERGDVMLSDPCEKCGERAETTERLTLDAWCMGKESLCYQYARYLGQQEGQSERDALRAEVEVYKRAMKVLATRLDDKEDCIEMGDCPYPAVPWATPNRDEVLSERCVKCLTAWAISEARRGE
jgi:hypothetical protein